MNRGTTAAQAISTDNSQILGVELSIPFQALVGSAEAAQLRLAFSAEGPGGRISTLRSPDGAATGKPVVYGIRGQGPSFALTATLADSLPGNPGGQAHPGDTIHYDAVITNTGTGDLGPVTFSDTPDSNTTLVPGSIHSTPLAYPGQVFTDEDTPVVVTLTGDDADGDSLTFSTVGTPTNGTIGAVTPVNADSAQVTYTPNGEFSGQDTISFRVTDDDPSTNDDAITVFVNAVNDAPVVNLDADDSEGNSPDFVASFTEGAGPVLIGDTDLTVTDIDSPSLASATITLTNVLDGASESLGANTTGTAITAVYTSGTGVLALTGTDTVANYQTVLRTVAYDNSSQAPNDTARTISVVANDGVDNSTTVNSTVQFTATNDAPVLTAGGAQPTFTENGGPVALDPAITVADSDSPNLLSATVTITNLLDGASEVLAANTTGTAITATYTTGTGVLSLSGTDSLANYQAVLQSVTYDNTSQNPTTTARSITFVANDGTLDSNTITKTLTLTAANDAPVLTAGGTLNYLENAAATAIDTTITATDVDNADLAGATVQITGNYENGSDVLDFADTATITGVFAAATGTLTLSGQDTVASYQAALRAVTFENTSQNPSLLQRTVTWIADDGAAANNLSAAVTSTINISSVNDAPAGTDNTVTTNEDVDHLFAAANFGFTDPADTPPNALLAVRISTLPAAGTLELSNVAVTAGQDIAAADLGNLTFTPALNASGTPYTSFTFQVQDDGGTANGGLDRDPTPNTLTINVTSVNDAPTGTNNAVTLNEDVVDFAFAAANFGFTDPSDSPANALLAVRITTLPAAGTLELSNVAVTAGQDIPAASIGNLTFTPAANASGTPYTSFTFQVQDNGGTANGGVDRDPTPNTLTINVTSVNDAPAGTDNAVTTNEDVVDFAFAAANFGFTDPSDSPPNVLLAVRITTLPGAGTLELSNVAVTAGQDIPAASIGNLTFTPASNASGTPYTSFTFQVQDDGGTANGGVDRDATPNTLTVNVTSVNDAPAGTDNAVTTNEDVVDFAFAAANFGFTDPSDSPSNALFAVRITTLPAAGTMELSNVAVTAGQDIPAASIGNLTFTPAANASGTPYTSFTFQVQDNGGTANGGVDRDPTPNTLTINVTSVNDAPAGTNNAVTTNEDVVDFAFAAANFGFTDPSDSPPNVLFAVRITTLPAAGTLELSNVAVTAGQDIPAASIGNLTFTPAANGSGTPYTTFTFQVQDDGGTANGGVDRDPTPNTLAINVNAANDAPAGTDNTVTTNEDVDHVFAAANFGFTDPIDSPPNVLFAVRITTLPAAGTIELSNVAVTAGQDIPAASIGNLTFTPAANASGTPYTSFTFQVQDDGGTANGGVDRDPTPNTLTINVNAVNDAPSGTDNAVTTNEDVVDFAFAAANFGFTDPLDTPPNTLLAVRITTLPAAGTLELSNVAVVAGQDIPAASIGNLTFTPALNAFGTPYTSFTFQVQDNGGTANGGVDRDPTANTLTINVNPVNDPPVADNDPFDFIGNTELRVDTGVTSTPHALETTTTTFGVIDGDSDPVEGDAIAVSAITVGACTDSTLPTFDCTDAAVGTVHMQPNGRFSFEPAPGDTGATETFGYTLTDNGTPAPASTTATVTLTRFERVWYVRNNASAGNGTSASPFNSLAPLNGAGGAGDSDLVNDYLFVHFGNGTTTNQASGLVLENGQHVIGEFAGLSIPVNLNGNGSPTVLLAQPGATACSGGPCRPLLDDTAAGVPLGLDATDVIPVEIVGVNLAGNVNAINWTTAAAFGGTGSLSIRDNIVRAAGSSGVNISLTGTGAINLAFHDNNLTATGTALAASETGTGSLTITGFHDNVVTAASAGAGLSVNTAVFDVTPGGAVQSVPGGTTLIGTPGDRIGGSGLTLTNVTGILNFANAASGTIGAGDLDIYTDSGAALSVSGGTGGFLFDVTPNAGTLVANTGAAAVISGADVDLQLTSLTSTTSGSGVSLTSVIGQFSAPSGSSITKSSGAGTAFSVDNSAAGTTVLTSTYAGTITNSSGTGRAVSVNTADTGSAISFTGLVNDSAGQGVSLTNNAGATISFSGGVTLSTGANAAFTATGPGPLATSGGTVTVTDPNPVGTAPDNTITTTTGTALNVAHTTIGANNLNFRSISAGTGAIGPANGIVLNNTGASGGLVVTGNSTGLCGGAVTVNAVGTANGVTVPAIADCTGGTIQNSTGDGIQLNNTRNVSITRMQIANSGGSGIFGDDLTNFSLISSFLDNNSDVATGAEANMRFNELLGSCVITNSTIQGAKEDEIRLTPSSGTLTNLAISGTVIGNDFNDNSAGCVPCDNGNGITISPTSTGNMTVNLTNSVIKDVFAAGIVVNGDGTTSRTFNASNTTFIEPIGDTAIPPAIPQQFGGVGISLQGSFSADLTFNVSNNTFLGIDSNAINFSIGTTATNNLDVLGTISGNVIGNSSVDSGSRDLIGIAMESQGDADTVVFVTNNTTQHTDQQGFFAQSRLDNDADAETGRFDLILRDNNFGVMDDNTAFPFFAIHGATIDSRNTSTLCLDSFSNTASSVGGMERFMLRNRDTSFFILERFDDGDGNFNETITNTSIVQTFHNGQNDAGSTTLATLTGTFRGFNEAPDNTCRSAPVAGPGI